MPVPRGGGGERDTKILNGPSHTLLVEAYTDIIAVKNNLEICSTVLKMHGSAFSLPGIYPEDIT